MYVPYIHKFIDTFNQHIFFLSHEVKRPNTWKGSKPRMFHQMKPQNVYIGIDHSFMLGVLESESSTFGFFFFCCGRKTESMSTLEHFFLSSCSVIMKQLKNGQSWRHIILFVCLLAFYTLAKVVKLSMACGHSAVGVVTSTSYSSVILLWYIICIRQRRSQSIPNESL